MREVILPWLTHALLFHFRIFLLEWGKMGYLWSYCIPPAFTLVFKVHWDKNFFSHAKKNFSEFLYCQYYVNLYTDLVF